MKTIARFKNAADAAFFQSMLRSEGIEALVIDSGAILALADDARVDVDDEDFAAASEVLELYHRGDQARAQLVEATHPAKGFPFLALWFVVAVIVFVGWDGLLTYLFLAQPEWSFIRHWHNLGIVAFNLVGVPFIGSLGISVKIFLLWLCWKVIRKRVRRSVPAEPRPAQP